jgi:hypothetical protein
MNNFFDKIFCLNLDSRPDIWQKSGYSYIEEVYMDYAFLKQHTYENFN